MGPLPAVGAPTGIQKGEQGLGPGLASGSRPPPSSVLSLQEPLRRGGGAGGLHGAPRAASLLFSSLGPVLTLDSTTRHHTLAQEALPCALPTCGRETVGDSASLGPGPTCITATFVLSFRKSKSWGPRVPHTSWISFNRASSWKVRFTWGRGAPREVPGQPFQDAPLL